MAFDFINNDSVEPLVSSNKLYVEIEREIRKVEDIFSSKDPLEEHLKRVNQLLEDESETKIEITKEFGGVIVVCLVNKLTWQGLIAITSFDYSKCYKGKVSIFAIYFILFYKYGFRTFEELCETIKGIELNNEEHNVNKVYHFIRCAKKLEWFIS